MAASARLVYYTKYFARKLLKCSLFDCKHRIKTRNGIPLIASALAVKLTCESRSKIEEPDASKLSREYLIKSSSVVTAENAIILLTQSALALQQAEKEYKEALLALVFLLEFKLTVLGNSEEEARIWDLILQGRDLVSTTKKKRDNLDILYKTTYNLVNVSAEVLYMTGADMVGVGAGERLSHLDMVINQDKVKTESAEKKLRDTEIKSINVEGKYAEEHSAELDEQLIALAEQQIQQNDKGVDNDKLMSEDDRKDNTDVFEELIKLDETSSNDTAEEL